MKKTLVALVTCLSLTGSLGAQAAPASASCAWLRDYLTPVVDFPEPGVVFQWYANLLKDPAAFRRAIQVFADRYREYNLDAIAGLDSRGFVFGAALAYELQVPFVLIRKPGKLPREVMRIDYKLEYGTAAFEIEVDSLNPEDRVLIIDDVLATGGTAEAASNLVRSLGAEVVEVACLIEIPILQGRKIVTAPVYSLLAIGEVE